MILIKSPDGFGARKLQSARMMSHIAYLPFEYRWSNRKVGLLNTFIQLQTSTSAKNCESNGEEKPIEYRDENI